MIYDVNQLQKDVQSIATVLGTYLPELSCWVYKTEERVIYYYRGAPVFLCAIYIDGEPIEIPSDEPKIHITSLVGYTTLKLAMKAEELNG